ncbi:uncharacterized protein LOC131693293 [Topomyia yanbarensis]|uniref:uncharacterized protein LOC131693293 n=1 Tax=Topomyia yanbarensis TaxID=2498891 RepID=UPI00273BABBC|nr:uncharacterized protein LOC131693293 [Topomyia yanbarensis]
MFRVVLTETIDAIENSFINHVDNACEKSAIVTNTIARIMPDISAPRSSMTRLLFSVSSSILRCGVPVCGAVLKTGASGTALQNNIVVESIRYCMDDRHLHHAAEDIECYNRRNTWNVRKTVRIDSMTTWRRNGTIRGKKRKPTG